MIYNDKLVKTDTGYAYLPYETIVEFPSINLYTDVIMRRVITEQNFLKGEVFGIEYPPPVGHFVVKRRGEVIVAEFIDPHTMSVCLRVWYVLCDKSSKTKSSIRKERLTT